MIHQTNIEYVKQKLKSFAQKIDNDERIYPNDMESVLLIIRMIVDEYEKGRIYDFFNGPKKVSE